MLALGGKRIFPPSTSVARDPSLPEPAPPDLQDPQHQWLAWCEMDKGKEGDSCLTALSDAKRSSVEPQYYSTYRELQLRILYYSNLKNHRSCWELVGSLLATCSKVLVWEILNCYRTCSISHCNQKTDTTAQLVW
jgi:hypothetical protein